MLYQRTLSYWIFHAHVVLQLLPKYAEIGHHLRGTDCMQILVHHDLSQGHVLSRYAHTSTCCSLSTYNILQYHQHLGTLM